MTLWQTVTAYIDAGSYSIGSVPTCPAVAFYELSRRHSVICLTLSWRARLNNTISNGLVSDDSITENERILSNLNSEPKRQQNGATLLVLRNTE